jgi:hypothetical protein
MALTIVTSCWDDYGKYLPEWASSVAAARPAAAVIAEFGGCGDEAYQAAKILDAAGIPATVVREPFTTMGAARNAAIEAAGTEWVMHLDADDLLLPGALMNLPPLMERADVISLGGKYPSGKVRTFPHVSARVILTGLVGCFSCSPFRRALWEQSPYPTEDLYVDRMLWIGFARQGARFVGTRWPGFVYRQHSDSFRKGIGPADLSAMKRQLHRAIRRP